jgi:hypothetical protein
MIEWGKIVMYGVLPVAVGVFSVGTILLAITKPSHGPVVASPVVCYPLDPVVRPVAGPD